MCAKWRRGYLPLLAGFLLVALGACGENPDAGTTTAGGGIGGTGISFGVITSRDRPPTSTATAAAANGGSITVNGIKFALDGATVILKDGAPATLNEVHTGMVAEVHGTIENDLGLGRADSVIVDDTVRGVVESDPVDNMFVAAGQTILVDDTTIFNKFNPLSPISITDIHQGDLIDIYGLVKGSGVVKAMYFERRTAPSIIKVRGLVQNLDSAAMTFTVGALTVNYGAAQSVPAGIRNDLFVEVHGTCAGDTVCGTLDATDIEVDKLGLDDAEWAQVEGFVTTVTPAALFTVGNQAVATSPSTKFVGGRPSDIVMGVKVEAEGSLAGGVVEATKIVFEDNIQLDANVATVGNGTLTLAGLPGITVTANSQTDFNGVAADLSNVLGANVRVRGRLDSKNPNTVIATELELRSPSPATAIVLQAPAQAITQGTSVTVLGITVNTAGLNFVDSNGQPIDSTAFFSALAVGDLVKVKGDLATMSTVTWGEIELEE